MAKQLKFWNGRGHGKYGRGGSLNVAAYSKKQAAEILTEATDVWITVSEIENYYSPMWGNDMAGINPTEPCVYGSVKAHIDPPKLIYPAP